MGRCDSAWGFFVTTANTPSILVDADAEAALLGAFLTSPDALLAVADKVRPADFGIAANGLVFAAIEVCAQGTGGVDAVTVAAELRRQKKLETAGGRNRLVELTALAGSVTNLQGYIDLLLEAALRRNLVVAGREVVAAAHQPDIPGRAILNTAEERIFGIGANRRADHSVLLPAAIEQTLAELAQIRNRALLGHSTGFKELDTLTSGFQAGQLILIAARPSVGKSAFALQIAAAIARSSHKHVHYASYEMSVSELTTRLLADTMKYDLQKLRSGEIPGTVDGDWVARARKSGENLSLVLDAEPPATLSGLRSQLRRASKQYPMGAVVVDYLQLMNGESGGKDSNRTQELADITRNLKRLATELEIPIIAVSQLNRQSEMRSNRRPQLSDLRDSGSLEQDASLVLLLFREHLVDPSIDESVAECIIAKQRNGPLGTVALRWESKLAVFQEITRPSMPMHPRPAGGPETAGY